MKTLQKYSSSHPQVLKGQDVEQIQQETESYKKVYEQYLKKNNEYKVQIEGQRRLIERSQIEGLHVTSSDAVYVENLHKQNELYRRLNDPSGLKFHSNTNI